MRKRVDASTLESPASGLGARPRRRAGAQRRVRAAGPSHARDSGRGSRARRADEDAAARRELAHLAHARLRHGRARRRRRRRVRGDAQQHGHGARHRALLAVRAPHAAVLRHARTSPTSRTARSSDCPSCRASSTCSRAGCRCRSASPSRSPSAVQEVLEPKGVGVVIEAMHLCMMMRGVQKQNSQTVTSARARHLPRRRAHARGVPLARVRAQLARPLTDARWRRDRARHRRLARDRPRDRARARARGRARGARRARRSRSSRRARRSSGAPTRRRRRATSRARATWTERSRKCAQRSATFPISSSTTPGIFDPKPLHVLTGEEFAKMMQVNLVAPFYVLRALLPAWREQHAGT